MTTAFGAGGSAGLEVFTATGVLGTINYPNTVDDLGMDDAGNMYIGSGFSIPSPGASPVALAHPIVTKYAFESTTPLATYTVSGSNGVTEVSASGAGRLMVTSLSNTTEYIDVWEAGQTGTPSFTIPIAIANQNCVTFTNIFLEHNGTLIVPMKTTNGSLQYNFYAVGSGTTPTSTMNESVVPQPSQCAFSDNYMSVGADGTLYVTEYTFLPEDTLAGLYVYQPTGNEYFVQTPSDSSNLAQPGPAPQAVDVDSSGNVYVTNDNSAYGSTGALTPDTLHSFTVYSPSMGILSPTPVRTVSTGLGAPYTMVVDNSSSGNGTAFISDFTAGNGNALEPNGAIHVVAPGSSTVTTIGTFTAAVDLVLYDGMTARNILSTGSHGSAGSAHGSAASRARFMMRLHR